MSIERILKIGFFIGMSAAMISCSKDSSLYKQYKKESSEKIQRNIAEDNEKQIIRTLEKYFDSSKNKDFKAYWECFSSEYQNMLRRNSSGIPNYAMHWTSHANGKPQLERINSIAINGQRALVNLCYSFTYPAFGFRMRHSESEAHMAYENSGWRIDNFFSIGREKTETFEPYQLEMIIPELP